MVEDEIIRELCRHKRGGRGRIRLVLVLSAESLHKCQRLQRKRVNVNFGPGRNDACKREEGGEGEEGEKEGR